MRRSDASSSAPSRNGVTSGSHNPSTIVLLLGVSRKDKDHKRKSPVRTGGALAIVAFAESLTVRRARKRNPPNGGFFRFQCAAARHGQNIAGGRADVNESRVPIHAPETTA